MGTQIALRIIRPRVPYDPKVLENIQSLGRACAKCAEVGGLDDKFVAIETGIDPGVWSRIKSDGAGVTWQFLERLMDAAGNEIPVDWQNLRRGWDPMSRRKLETELEKRLRESEEKNAELTSKLATITEFVREARAA